MTQVRKIIHCDMDSYFASVEMRENPALKQVPLAVGGSHTQRGVVATANYIAREYGVHSAMSTAKALKLCPNLVVVPGNMSLYKQISQQIREIFFRYTDLVEPLSLDEAYLDVTNSPHCQGSATLIAKQITKTIHQELNLTCSAGVAPNKFLAKIASDLNKPNGISVITPQQVDQFIATLPLKKIPGVGRSTQAKLAQLGLNTCLDVQKTDQRILLQHFGKFGARLYDYSFGQDQRDVNPTRIPKSVGVERTYPEDLKTTAACIQEIDKLLPKLDERLQAKGDYQYNQHLTLKIKFSDFKQTTISRIQPAITLDVLTELLHQALPRGQGKQVRLIGVTIGLEEKKSKQIQYQLAL